VCTLQNLYLYETPLKKGTKKFHGEDFFSCLQRRQEKKKEKQETEGGSKFRMARKVSKKGTENKNKTKMTTRKNVNCKFSEGEKFDTNK